MPRPRSCARPLLAALAATLAVPATAAAALALETHAMSRRDRHFRAEFPSKFLGLHINHLPSVNNKAEQIL